jgi:putative peptidoglycan lipid II flippase
VSTKKTIKQKMLLVSCSTLASRLLGIIRELLWSRYLGAGILSDAFFTAYKIPNSLRKIFAEGALSAAFIPSIVQTVRLKGRDAIGELMMVAFLLFESIVLVASAFTMYYAEAVIHVIAGGFSDEQVALAAPWLRILMPFIFFISSSALLAGALQSVNHFFVPAFTPVLLNITFILGTILCMCYKLPISSLCWFILTGGAIQLLWHIITYIRLQFKWGPINAQSFENFKPILTKFALCLPATGVEELNLFIDTSFASYLAAGSISLLSYANRFMFIPLGVFGVTIATILLPHFSKISSYAPKRLSFYLLETTKLITWLILPVALLMALFASKIFITIFLSDKFSLAQAYEAGLILQVYLTSAIFISLNKSMRNIFYALHNTWVPSIISIISVTVNYCANSYFITPFQAPGLALATSIASITQSVLFALFLHTQFNIKIYIAALAQFLLRYIAQLVLLAIPFYALYYALYTYIAAQPTQYAHLLLNTMAFWLWTGPVCLLFLWSLVISRHIFKIKLHFID